MIRPSIFLTIGAVVSGLVTSCADSASCDPDQDLIDGYCIAKTKPPAPKPDAGACDAGPDGDAGDGGDACAPPAATCDQYDFGTPCADSKTHSDCGCATPYCAVQPGTPGYCTAPGCDVDPSICPDGWNCFDVSIFAPGEPWICTRPAN